MKILWKPLVVTEINYTFVQLNKAHYLPRRNKKWTVSKHRLFFWDSLYDIQKYSKWIFFIQKLQKTIGEDLVFMIKYFNYLLIFQALYKINKITFMVPTLKKLYLCDCFIDQIDCISYVFLLSDKFLHEFKKNII